MKKHFLWFGGAYLLLAMALVSTVLFWHFHREVKISEAEEHKQPFVEEDFRESFWDGFYENHQSEYFQLFFQFLIMGAGAAYLARSHDHDMKRIEMKVDEVLRQMGLDDPDRVVPEDWQE